MQLQLVKIDDNNFKFDGVIKYSESEFKSVEVDGEVYTKTNYIQREIKASELNESFKWIRTVEFKELEYYVNIEDSYMFTNGLSDTLPTNHSTNDYVNLIMNLFDTGMMDKRISRISTTKNTKYLNTFSKFGSDKRNHESFKNILETMEVEIIFYYYGFNNVMYYTIKLEDFVNVKYELIDSDMLSYLIRNKIFEKEFNPTQNTINLLTLKSKK